MDVIAEHNNKYNFFREITGAAMEVHAEYKSGLLESAYEAALKYLLEQKGYEVKQQVYLPMYWKDVKLEQSYRMDLVVNNNVILELKATAFAGDDFKRQLWNYMHLTHTQYGMIINFGAKHLYTDWYERHPDGEIERVRLY